MPTDSATPAATERRDLIVTAVALAALLAWEFSGLDLALTRLFATPTGFPLKDTWFTSQVLHEGGRSLSIFLLVLLVVDAVRPIVAGPPRRARAYWLVVLVATTLAVPGLKRFSRTSCPWDLADFGGRAAYVPHWLPGVADGGPGRCFPSGHAVAAFAFFGVYFLWRRHRPVLARAVLAATLVLGLVYGTAQLARGAHHASHTMWSAWLCWAIAVLAEAAARRWPSLTAPAKP